MKGFFILFCLLVSQYSTAQQGYLLSQIAEKEAVQHSKRFSSIQLATPANGLNIDVIQYRSHWLINPANDSIRGKVAIVFKPKSLAVSQFTIDLANNMIVSSVRFRGVNVSSAFMGASTLSINLGTQTVNPGQLDSVVITYNGRPIASPFGSFTRNLLEKIFMNSAEKGFGNPINHDIDMTIFENINNYKNEKDNFNDMISLFKIIANNDKFDFNFYGYKYGWYGWLYHM
jgi:hypothetical protein